MNENGLKLDVRQIELISNSIVDYIEGAVLGTDHDSIDIIAHIMGTILNRSKNGDDKSRVIDQSIKFALFMLLTNGIPKDELELKICEMIDEAPDYE